MTFCFVNGILEYWVDRILLLLPVLNLFNFILISTFSEQMEVELQGQDLKSVLEMEDKLLKQKGKVCFR